MVFKDDNGEIYMYYGGWKHANVVRLAPDLLSVIPFPDGETYKEITPDPAYVEGSFMLKRKGVYYLMWSEGDWTGPDYGVAYAMSSSPFGPFKRVGKILEQDAHIAKGAGHHSVVNIPGTDDWYIAYHRRPLGTDDGNQREVAIEHLYFNADGTIKPVIMTKEGVAPRRIR
jgi:beta-xylosidase